MYEVYSVLHICNYAAEYIGGFINVLEFLRKGTFKYVKTLETEKERLIDKEEIVKNYSMQVWADRFKALI